MHIKFDSFKEITSDSLAHSALRSLFESDYHSNVDIIIKDKKCAC